MRVRRWIAGCSLLGALVGGSAMAQDVSVDPVDPIGAEEVSTQSRPGFRVQANAGVADYGGGVGDATRPGALFGVSASTQAADVQVRDLGTRPRLDAEVGYEATSNAVNDIIGDGDGALWRHNVSGLVKGGVNIGRALPYIGAGVGASYVNVTERAEDNGLRNDFMGEIPLAVGLDFDIGRNITAGARGTYRVLVFDEFADPVNADNPGGGLLSANLSVGGRF